MRNREHEIILGAVVFVAAIILVVGTVWLSERYAGAAGGYRIKVKFDSVPGLQVGNPVTFRGVWVGKVLSIWLEQGEPTVLLGFAEVEDLPIDSKFLLKSDGLLGGQMIEIQIGTSAQRLSDGQLVQGISSSGIDLMMTQSGQLVENVNRAVEQITTPQNLDHLAHTLSNIDTTTMQMNLVLAQNQENLKRITGNLADASRDAKNIVGDNKQSIDSTVVNLSITLERLAKISAQMETTSVSINQTFENLNQISQQIKAGRGTVGKFIQDDSVYEHLDRTLTSVDSLVEDIKRDPSRYFRFSVF